MSTGGRPAGGARGPDRSARSGRSGAAVARLAGFEASDSCGSCNSVRPRSLIGSGPFATQAHVVLLARLEGSNPPAVDCDPHLGQAARTDAAVCMTGTPAARPSRPQTEVSRRGRAVARLAGSEALESCGSCNSVRLRSSIGSGPFATHAPVVQLARLERVRRPRARHPVRPLEPGKQTFQASGKVTTM
jgi:hypothetical protein